MIFYFIVLAALVLLGAIFWYLKNLIQKRILKTALSQTLFLVKIPKDFKEEKDFKSEINHFEEFLSSVSHLGESFALELAVPHIGEEIHFYMAVPRKSEDAVIKQLQGIWSGASVERSQDDYSIFSPNGSFSGAYLLQKEHFSAPVRTYKELDLDTMNPILGGFSKVDEIGEGAGLQIIFKAAPDSAKKKMEGILKSLKKGESIKDAIEKEQPSIFKMFGDAFSGKKKEEGEEKKEPKIADENAIAVVQSKLQKPLFEVNVRLMASSATPLGADSLLDEILAGFNQFGTPERNEFKMVKVKGPQKLAYRFIFRMFDEKEAMILSSEEIASLYHFPASSTEAPKIKWLKSKEAPPPSDMPKSGTLLGESSFRGEKRPVYITDDDRGRHLYMIGQTGTGKTTLLKSMMIDDIENGKGIALIDPHGEFAETILSRIPDKRADDVIYFDPADLQKPLGINMLDFDYSKPEEKTFIVNEMQSIFNKLFSQETMGPMFEQYMRNALLLLMEDMVNEPATLIEVPRVFTDTEYRKRKLARIQNPVVVDFWEKEAVKAGGEASLANMTPYITSKFNNFISNDYMRPIIGQPKSSFNFREVMDSGKILIINLSKGRIGDINAGLLGMVFTGKILMAALSRVDIADEKKRKPFYLYIDEFQNFTTDSISTIFSEARKYRLSLTVAHQFIAQLEEKIRDSVFGNVGSQIAFRVGASDAEFLVKQFEPIFNQNDLMNIDNLNAYIKLLINGQTSKPFNFKISTKSWEKGEPSRVEKYKELSRNKFGKDRQEIEADIYKRLRE